MCFLPEILDTSKKRVGLQLVQERLKECSLTTHSKAYLLKTTTIYLAYDFGGPVVWAELHWLVLQSQLGLPHISSQVTEIESARLAHC